MKSGFLEEVTVYVLLAPQRKEWNMMYNGSSFVAGGGTPLKCIPRIISFDLNRKTKIEV